MKTILSKTWYRPIAVIAAGALFIAGCASVPPPTEQMAVSKSALTSASSAGGGEYASVEMRSAREKMEGAERAMDAKDYENARWLAEEAEADARLAERKSQSARAQKSAVVMQEDIRVLREEINRKSK